MWSLLCGTSADGGESPGTVCPVSIVTRQLATQSTRRVSKGAENAEPMSKTSKRIALILVAVVIALLAVAQHVGWIAGPPPLLAPGVK